LLKKKFNQELKKNAEKFEKLKGLATFTKILSETPKTEKTL
jgi:hypothetical protein